MIIESGYIIVNISIVALVTWGLRAFPFLVFGRKELPPMIRYLGSALPPAIMTILVAYCIRSINIVEYPYGLSEVMSILLIIFIHSKYENTYVSIITGTLCYMILIRM